MSQIYKPRDPFRPNPEEVQGFLSAFFALLLARWDARDNSLRPSQNPVSVVGLRQSGVDESILLWLLFQGHVKHLKFHSQAADGSAVLEEIDSLLLLETSYLVFTDEGEKFADQFLADVIDGEKDSSEEAWNNLWLGRFTPRFEKEPRVFAWGHQSLKQFRQPAPNQELILTAAEEISWLVLFDDPLPMAGDINPKVRLHDAIKGLNHHQRPYLIHFKGDGTGRRLGWEFR